MFERSRRLSVAALLLVLAAVIPVSSEASSAPTQEDYADVVERLEEARRLVERMERRERGLRSEISATDAQRDSLRVEVEELAALVADAEGRLARAARSLEIVEAELGAKTAELNQTLEGLSVAHAELQARAVEIYKDGPASIFDFVFGATDFRDLVSRFQYVVRIFSSDEARLEEIQAAKARALVEREAITTLRDSAAEQFTSLQSERDRVSRLKRSVDARQSQLTSELRGQYRDLEHVQSQKARYLREQQELEAESRRIASFLKGRGGGAASAGPGGMIWPTSGPVTSGYGWRTHPIFGTRRFHSGIDIGAPSGQGVSAAAGGEVIYAGPKSGYGNTVIVDHGGGLATLYAHLSAITAGTGRQLGRGDRLGRVGCSGYCTGPHLHFEVRVNGEPQNPMRWLP
jgi:murein DD-endopeptidase MepM/ murein hydrolase activator NlpD